LHNSLPETVVDSKTHMTEKHHIFDDMSRVTTTTGKTDTFLMIVLMFS